MNASSFENNILINLCFTNKISNMMFIRCFDILKLIKLALNILCTKVNILYKNLIKFLKRGYL